MPLLAMSAETTTHVLLGITVIVGVLLCFFGTRLFRGAFALGGMVFGAAAAAYVAWRLTASPEAIRNAATATPSELLHIMSGAANHSVLIVWACAGGIAGGILSFFLQHVGMFALGAWLGWLVTNLMMSHANTDVYWHVLAAMGLLGGVLALVLRKTLIIVSTALNGAFALMFAIYALLKSYSISQAAAELHKFNADAYVVLGCTVVLGLVGGYIQFITRPKEGAREGAAKKPPAKKGPAKT
jgi:hypothetical protein